MIKYFPLKLLAICIFIGLIYPQKVVTTANKGLLFTDTITLKELLQNNPAMQQVVYKQVNNTALKMYYIKPANAKPGKKYPAIIWIHGGAWTGGNADIFFAHAKYFALRNAVGISIEYRLVTPNGNSVMDCLADCKSAIRYIRAHAAELNIDPDNIVVAGDSAGGHLAACLGIIDGFNDANDNLLINAIPNAMILYNPCTDFTILPLAKNIMKHKFSNFKYADTASLKEEDIQLAKALSPMFHIHAKLPPTLVLHGLNDKVILPQQSIQFTDSMKKYGNNCELILLENTRHAFAVPNYTASEEVVVNAIVAADQFLIAQGILKGKPTLRVGKNTAWVPKK